MMNEGSRPDPTTETGDARPPVAVIVPFAGAGEEAVALFAALSALNLRDGDRVLVVDNSPQPVAVPPAGSGIETIRAGEIPSSYYARNAGAAHVANEWLLFIDADCLPSPSLVEDYFAEPPDSRCGIVAGEVDGDVGAGSLLAEHAVSRRHLATAEHHLEKGPYPAGATANLLVRRSAWEDLGGFYEVRSGADLEFCWRAQEAGWEFEFQPKARTRHSHPQTLGEALRKARRYGPGQSWLNRRYPRSAQRPPLGRQVVRALGGAAFWFVTLRWRRAVYKLIDGLWMLAFARGYYAGDNRPARAPVPAGSALLAAGEFPARDMDWDGAEKPGITAIALSRPRRQDPEAARRVAYVEDVGPLRRARAVLAYGLRHPVLALSGRRHDEGLGVREIAVAVSLARNIGAARIEAGPGGEELAKRLAAAVR